MGGASGRAAGSARASYMAGASGAAGVGTAAGASGAAAGGAEMGGAGILEGSDSGFMSLQKPQRAATLQEPPTQDQQGALQNLTTRATGRCGSHRDKRVMHKKHRRDKWVRHKKHKWDRHIRHQRDRHVRRRWDKQNRYVKQVRNILHG